MGELPPQIAASRAAKIREHQGRATGILHLGAHTGQEREVYRELSKPVVWVEANPAIFPLLQSHIASIPSHLALCALLGDTDGKKQTFHISNNYEGVSSSIFPFGEYAAGQRSLWPELDLKMVSTITLPMVRLDTLLAANNVRPEDYNFWVLDLQGAELLALAGAEHSLRHCTSLLAEVSKAEVYRGGPDYEQLRAGLAAAGFAALWEPHLLHDDVLFVK
jgi:FkbM family methyltransferase